MLHCESDAYDFETKPSDPLDYNYSMSPKKPRKPTGPFGWIRFGASGEVCEETFTLPTEKTAQELEVALRFRDQLYRTYPSLEIGEIEPLPERDHDFAVSVNGEQIEVQLTEIVLGQYGRRITEEEYLSLPPPVHISGSGDNLWLLDPLKLNQVLVESIKKKLEKHYWKAPGTKLWLLIFSTNQGHLLTEYAMGNAMHESTILKAAREYLATLSACVFDEIWFTSFLTRPVRIWPSILRSTGYLS